MATKEVSVFEGLLQTTISDLFVEHINYKHRHWNTSGITFRDVHLMFDEATEVILEALDEMGEYAVVLGVNTGASVSAIVEEYQVKNQTLVSSPATLISGALDNAVYLKKQFTKLTDLANEHKEYGLANSVGGIITNLDKLIYKYSQFMDL